MKIKFSYSFKLLLVAIFLISGCATVTIPEGKENIILRNAEITPNVITEKGSLITIEYDASIAFEYRNDVVVGYVIATKGMTKKPSVFLEDVLFVLRLSDLNVEKGKIKFPITSKILIESKDWWKTYKVHQIKGRVASEFYWDVIKEEKKKYIGNTTISLYLASEREGKLSNILRVPAMFE